MKFFIWLLFVVIIGGVVGYVWVDASGKAEWRRVQAELAAAGEALDLDTLLGDEPPDAQNFARFRLFQELREHPERIDEKRTMLQALTLKDTPGFDSSREAREINRYKLWKLASGQDLGAFLEKNSPVRADGKEVLDKLHVWEEQLAEISAAARRPHSRWQKLGEQHQLDDKPQFAYMGGCQQIVRLFKLRAQARLHAGDSAGAAQDIDTILRIAGHLQEEPSLIMSLVANALIAMSMQPVWEGLSEHTFSDADLAVISAALARIDFDKAYSRAMRGERIFSIDMIEVQMHGADGGLPKEIDIGPLGVIDLRLARLFFALAPNGYFYHNLAAQAEFMQERMIDSGLSIESYGALQQFAEQGFSKNIFSGESVLRAVSSSYVVSAKKALQIRGEVENARIAVALERFRLKRGSYPGRLAELAPAFLDEVPPDPITNGERIYRVKADGTPVVYSVGLNRKDDGGVPKRSAEYGDWVWQYSLPDGVDEETYTARPKAE